MVVGPVHFLVQSLQRVRLLKVSFEVVLSSFELKKDYAGQECTGKLLCRSDVAASETRSSENPKINSVPITY